MTLQKRYLLRALVCIFLLAVFAVLDLNLDLDDSTTLTLSQESGFYDTDFQLELQANMSGDLYYTLDGSDPTHNSIPYTGPISITSRSQEENLYAGIQEVSTGFMIEDIQQMITQFPEFEQEVPGYVLPEAPVDKCTIVRAALFQGRAKVAQVTGTYFIGLQDQPEYQNIRMVSLVTDPQNLFDWEEGIYVTGEKSQNPGILGVDTSPLWRWWPANYHVRGQRSERPAHIQIFDTDRSLLLSSDCGIRIQGAGSRGMLPKSLSVFAREEYSGSEVFSADLFENGIQPHKFILFAGGDDGLSKIRDVMVQTMIQDLNVSTMDFSPCAVFLDGEYWGTYYITESYNSKYIYNHYGVPEDEVILIKEDEVSEGKSSDIGLFQEVESYVLENDITSPAVYEALQRQIDLESYADYYASMIYIARHGDWPVDNVAIWRSRSSQESGTYRDGRWRWMVFDLNSPCLELENAQTNTLALTRSYDEMFNALCENEAFRQLLCQRLRHIATQIYTQDNCSAFLEQYLATMTAPLEANSLRFWGDPRTDELLQNVQDIQDFFRLRSAYLDTMIRESFGEESITWTTGTN